MSNHPNPYTQGPQPSWPPVAAPLPPASAPPGGAALAFGGVALGVFVLTLAPMGLAAKNAIQGVEMGADTTFPTFIRAEIVEADAKRVLVFAAVSLVMMLAGLSLAVLGRRRMPGQLALGLLSVQLLALCGVAAHARTMPKAEALQKEAAAEREEAKRSQATQAPTTAADAPMRTNRQTAYLLGGVLGNTVLGRANGASAEVVERQRRRSNAMASVLGADVAELPPLTGDATSDRVASLEWLLLRGGKDVTQTIRATQGEDVSALVELGIKTAVARMLYAPKASTNAAYLSVLDRTSKRARLRTPAIADAAAAIRQNAPSADVWVTLDKMDDAITAELASPPAPDDLPAPIGLTTPVVGTPAATPAAATTTTAASTRGAAMGATARGGVPQANGNLPPEVIQRIVSARSGQVRACYEPGLRKNPKLSGHVNVRFVIGASGAVSSASDGGSDLPDGSVVSCVVRTLGNLQFPAPSGGVVTVMYPYTFTPAQ